MKVRLAITALAAAAGLSACAPTLGPPPAARPDLPLAYPETYAEEPGAAPVRAAADVAWREAFGDPRLVGLIGQAFETNRDLAAATARIAEAAALNRIARADRFPTVDLSAGAGIGEGSGGSGGTGVDPTEPGQPGQPDPSDGDGGGEGGGGEGESYRLAVGISAFELDFWGRIRSLEAASLARYLATEEARRAFQLTLIADVADAYLREREAEAAELAADRALLAAERGLILAQRLFEEGEGTRLDVEAQRVLVTDAEADLADIRLARAQATNALRLLIGAAPADDLPAPLTLAEQSVVGDLDPGLPSALLLRRPDVREAELEVQATGADLNAARAALFPTIRLSGDAGFASPDLGDLLSSEAAFWNAAADLLQPLFDAGRRRGAVEVEAAGLRIALADYEIAIQTAFQEVADALAARRRLAERQAAQERGFAAEAERLRLARLRFEAGVDSSIDVLTAERSLRAAEQALIATRREALVNAVTLYVALGGGPDV